MMYFIKARVNISSDDPRERYKPLPVSGLFLPKGKRKRHEDIRKLCEEHIIKNMCLQSPELTFKVSNLKITPLSLDFVINEAKIS
jgi:hypothetical protein